MGLTCRDLKIAPIVYREVGVLINRKGYIKVGKFKISERITASSTIFSAKHNDNNTTKY